MSQMRVSPKLVVSDADAALTFYAEVLGARLLTRHTMGESVVFAALELPDGGQVQVKDPDDADPAPAGDGDRRDPRRPHRRPRRHHGAGARARCGAGLRGRRPAVRVVAGSFRDPFGHEWIVGTEVRMSDADVQAALDEWARQS
ncbi:VOC family protein [Serinicoccus sp. CNJ-927]|uniref:VOC family protein n=1 Tax=Serinicoccus sp. CNJ-927 TaxID=1904970 RepID=UPI00096A5C34|nr:VOC family protein [Serinicoccus sp. CNJ-927]